MSTWQLAAVHSYHWHNWCDRQDSRTVAVAAVAAGTRTNCHCGVARCLRLAVGGDSGHSSYCSHSLLLHTDCLGSDSCRLQ